MAGALLGVLFAAGNAKAAATTYTVNATTDTGTGSGTTGDLRYAITQAESAGNSGSTINITATGTITLTSNLPAITQDTTIAGPTVGSITISGAGKYAIFQISSAATVDISGVTIANGSAAGTSGGILNDGALTVSNVTLVGNSATGSSSLGGGITNNGTLTVTNSTFVGNTASAGGGISNGQNDTVTVLNSTFTGNSSNAIDNYSANAATTLTVVNSILTGDTGTECVGNGCPANGSNGNVVGVTAVQAKLLPLANYGGTTQTILLQPGSAAICKGTATPPSPLTLPAADQRGFPLNVANCSNGGVDAGAVQTNYLMVTTATDPAPGSCTSSACSLRDAISAANTEGGDIAFNSSLNGSTITISPTQGPLPAITGAVNIIGPEADQLTVSGGGSMTIGSVFTVNSGAEALIYGLTVSDGAAATNGGGINNSGTLSVIDCAISGNTASLESAPVGGGIYSTGSLTIIGSSISGNTASGMSGGGGGGIDSSGSLSVINSTISGNLSGQGGGINSSGAGTLTNVTVSGNSVGGNPQGGGIYNTGTLTLANSIVAGNTASTNPDISGTYTDKGGNQIGTSVSLAPLGNYGGPTQTMLPLPGSPAICAGSSTLAVDANGLALTTDQRGVALGTAAYCAAGSIDSGAVQSDYTSAQFTNDTNGPTGTTYSALINQAVTPAPILSVTENGQNTGNIPVTLTFTGAGTSSGLGPVTTVAGTGATFSSIKIGTAGASDTLSVSWPIGTKTLTASANLEIDGPVTLSPASGALTDANIGAAYSTTLVASGGKGGYIYSVSTGSTLPSFLTLNSSTGVLSGTPTATGNYSFSITVTDKKGNTGSAAYTLAVDLDQTGVAVTSSKNPSNVDDSVTFTATVTNTSGTSVPSVGTVAFTSDGSPISGCGTKALAAGGSSATATCTVNSLAAAASTSPHSIKATYTGDSATYAGSFGTMSQTVNKATTSVTVTSSGTSGLNQQVTLTATISPTSPVSLGSGTVAFSDGTNTISGCGTQAVNTSTGQATCTYAFTTAGSHTISAIYSGDTNYAQTTTANVTTLALAVSKANTNLAISSADNTTSGLGANTSNLNDSVTFTATVAPASPVTGGTALSGKVAFTSGTQTLCAAAAGTWDGAAQTYTVACTTSALIAGSSTVTATYSNDSNYTGSTSNVTQTVNKEATSLAVASSAATSTVNQSLTFTASVTPFTGQVKLSGNVTFTATNTSTNAVTTLCNGAVGITASTGVAACTTASMPAGSYTITASYANDPNYDASSNTVAQTVGKAAVTINFTSSPNPSTVNQQVTLSATVSAPGGGTALNGQVTFTSDGNPISDCPATTINPNSPTVVCKTTSLALGTHALVANYGSDANFSDNSSTPVSQIVNPAPTSLTIVSSSSANTSVVDQAVNFTATVSGASGATHFTGNMSFTDNGNAISGCSAMAVGATTGSATCSTSTLLRGSHTIAATYSGDTSFNTSTNSLTQTVNPGNSTITLVSSPNPSIALNPKGYNDQVGLTATVGPANGVPLSGSVTFTDNGAPIAECQSAVPVNSTTGTASCITSSLAFGSHTIQAAYNGDNNFTASGASITQSVQDYTLAASPTSTVTVGQRSTNTTDAFSQEAITVAATPIAGFTGQLALTCNVVPVSAPEGAVPPTCILGSSSMDVTASAQQQPVSVTIDAGTGSNPVATTGSYNVSITGVDSNTGLTRTSAAFVVNIRFQAAPITFVSGATTGNTSTVQFSLPPNVGITSIQCASVTGPTLTSSVAPVALSMGCTFNPSTIAAASTSQDVMVTVAVSTGATTTAQLNDHRTTVVMAGMIGLPLLLLLGLMPSGKSSRKLLIRFMGVAFAVVLILQGTGCGGGQFTAPPSVSGQTPPGSYNILVEGTGTDHQLYQAVIQVNVTR